MGLAITLVAVRAVRVAASNANGLIAVRWRLRNEKKRAMSFAE
jgi:hypothetical protein